MSAPRILAKIFTESFQNKGRLFCSQASKWSTTVKTQDWNRAVADAEKIVGHPTTYFSLKFLLSEEFTSIATHLRKLIGTDHPILKTAKRLVYHGKTNMQTRGLVVLLLSKAAGHATTCSDIESASSSGVTTRQHTLAEITEMIHTAHLIHKGILNLSPASVLDENTLEDLHFGNKISILSGDYLLANACKALANLRNCKVVDLISKAIGDFMQAEFLGDRDKQGNSVPIHGMNLSSWEEKNYLSSGSLVANSCKATLELAGHSEAKQIKGYEFGKNIAFAWQVYADLQPFVDSLGHPPGIPFDLTSLPVIFHLQNNPNIVESLRSEIDEDVNTINFKALYESIIKDDSIEKTKVLLNEYSQHAADVLPEFGTSPSIRALLNIVDSLRE